MENPNSIKLLTIAIPTWNRANYLKELLEQVTFQISDFQLENEIELLISNNDSDDNTEEIVNVFRNKFPFISYNKNSKNIGAKSNVIKSMELSSAEFVMVIGDDDRIREGCLAELITFLKSNDKTSVVIDQSDFKKKKFDSGSKINLEQLVLYYYWLIGNAGHYIVKTDYVKKYVAQYGYNFFNECWPHTQIIILGLQNSTDECMVADIHILKTGLHTEVMIYSSLYLWRTCYYELLVSINDLKNKISLAIYRAARIYLKNSLTQQLFNILQCGIFVDTSGQRKKTRKHILQHLNVFTFYEKLFLLIITIALSLPLFISKSFSNLFIFCLKGNNGLKKKNDFVRKELSKKLKQRGKENSIRTLEFEK